jgi:hypothetical protein
MLRIQCKSEGNVKANADLDKRELIIHCQKVCQKVQEICLWQNNSGNIANWALKTGKTTPNF